MVVAPNALPLWFRLGDEPTLALGVNQAEVVYRRFFPSQVSFVCHNLLVNGLAGVLLTSDLHISAPSSSPRTKTHSPATAMAVV